MYNVLLFAQLREVLKTANVELDEPCSTAGELRAVLMKKGPLWEEYLHPERCLVAVNQTMSDDTTPLNPGDEVAFFPPVTGG